ncbi:anti-sigma factor [Dokdonia sp. Hel_I_53]|uniref:anti-sigma factor n=1 Tax=Dokdonia sp. Hel_I_53 TaxID=1566287 RepID=UPI00119AA686|nr:anti-sigma factor [Dokdonia sp. Hel_I_53]TVZ51973.1 anti-sigma-K factor rskA [Dokdonia sp. Hel_I_53]
MKDENTYIDSGVLELFVYGTLPEDEMVKVAHEVLENKTLLDEVVSIEGALMQLSSAAAPYKPKFKNLNISFEKDEDVIPLSRKRTPITSYLGWAAALVLLFGLAYVYTEKSELENRIVDTERELLLQEGKTLVAEENLEQTKSLLDVVRARNVISIPLAGQEIAPEAYASVFWDKENNKAYIDVKGLPEPPEGKVYQVWSLTLEPLTPTSLGVLNEFDTQGSQLFEFSNPNSSEAFGITLEPAGGSVSPTLEQLYTLGVVQTS